jgi:hypothetical protein
VKKEAARKDEKRGVRAAQAHRPTKKFELSGCERVWASSWPRNCDCGGHRGREGRLWADLCRAWDEKGIHAGPDGAPICAGLNVASLQFAAAAGAGRLSGGGPVAGPVG